MEWQQNLVDRLSADGIHLKEWANAGLSATTVATSSNPSLSTFTGTQMDGRLPKMFHVLPGNVHVVLLNWGVNEMSEVGVSLDGATWKANYSYIIDHVHARFPNAKIFITYPWAVNQDAAAATMHGWIDDLLVTHAGYLYPGVDEAVTLKWTDNGATRTDLATGSGVHYCNTGVAPEDCPGADAYAADMATAISTYFP